MNLSFKQLRAFKAVVSTGSTTAAAAVIFVTQPAVSRLISTLEDAVGFKIFERKRGRLTLTIPGQTLYQESERILDSIEDFSVIAEEIRVHKNARIRVVGTPSMMASSHFASGINLFISRYPNVRVVIESRTRLAIEKLVNRGQSDLGIMLLPPNLGGEPAETFARKKLLAVFNKKHPLSKKAAISIRDVIDEPLIIPGKGSLIRVLIDSAFQSAGVKPRIRVETRTSINSFALASKGVGIGLIDGLAIPDGAHNELQVRPWLPEITLNYGFITHYSVDEAPLITLLKECISACFSDE